MKLFIKNSYLFLIFFILLLSKDFIMNFFNDFPKIEYESLYIKALEEEINNINVIKNNSFINKFSYGKIIYKNPYHINSQVTMLIDSDDIQENDYVVNNDGLVGIVDKVYKNYAIVNLVNSQNIFMQVKVNDCYGILKFNDNFYVENVDSLCNIGTGDTVYTSDLGYYDEKIVVGNIIKQNIKATGEKQYQINFQVNFNKLNYVVIFSRVNENDGLS